MVEGMSVVVNVMLSLMSVMSPPTAPRNPSLRTVVKLCTFGCLDSRGDVCMRVANKQPELPEPVSDSVHFDMQYDENSITLTAGPVCPCGSCNPVIVLGLSVMLSWYPMSWVRLLR